MRVIFSIILFVFASLPVFSQTEADTQTPEAAPTVTPIQALKAAMAAKDQGDWDGALALAQPAGFVGIDLIEWHRLRASQGSFQDTLDFLQRRSDWPGLPLLRKRSEVSIGPEESATDILIFFSEQEPRTAHGALQMALAYRSVGREGAAVAEARRGWVTFDTDAQTENVYLSNFGDVLADDHLARLDALQWSKARVSLLRHLGRVDADHVKLAQARLALQTDANGVDILLDQVPANLKNDAGLAFDRFEWRMRAKRRAEAIELLLQRSTSPKALGRPEKWADERHDLARDLSWAGNHQRAYDVASRHFLADGPDFAALEWLSGFLALRKLDRPDLALFHFQRHGTAVTSPISLGRTHYWQGRAHDALGNSAAAQAAYLKGSKHQTAFYGLLAAEKAGVGLDAALAGTETYPGWRTAPFVKSSVFEAGLLLLNAERPRLGVRFLTHLTESLSAQEVGQITGMAEEIGLPYLQLMLAKRGVKYGTLLERPYYPLHPLATQTADVPAELAMAIARRESEFFVDARSGVGALGLMQLMPPTAREMAGKLGVSFSRARLTQDPKYNAQLGVRYLQELIGEFGNSPIQIAAAYNAGPSRPKRWMDQLGDPRRGQIDVVDWIEQIPFDETRNYVMRVSESLPVYRARLSGQVGQLNFLQEITGNFVVPAPPPPPITLDRSLRPIARPAFPAGVPATE